MRKIPFVENTTSFADMPVSVYWNLRQRCWSVRLGNKVIFHARILVLHDVRGVVSQAGRARVLRERKKNVHAFLKGTIACYLSPEAVPSMETVIYNPYKHESFVFADTEEPYSHSPLALLRCCNGRPLVQVQVS